MKRIEMIKLIGLIALLIVVAGCSLNSGVEVPNVNDLDVEDVFVEGEESNVHNLLSANAADIETDLTGFMPASGVPELERDITKSRHGNASLRIKGTAINQGTWLASRFVPDKNNTYTASVYVYGSPGDQVFIQFEEKRLDGGGLIKRHDGDIFTLLGNRWERIHVTAALGEGDSVGIAVRNAQNQRFEFWLDQFQLELGNEPTQWKAPPVNKNLLTYNQASAEIDHRGFIATAGRGTQPRLTIDHDVSWEGNSSLKVDWIGDGSGEQYYLWPTEVPDQRGAYTASVYIKGTPGDRYQFTLEEKGVTFTGVVNREVGEEFELKTDDWERHDITINMSQGQTLGLLVRHMNVSATTAWFDGFQIEQGAAVTEWESPQPPYSDEDEKHEIDDAANNVVAWRSNLYPEDWTPCTVDSAGRFLQDFSFAGYHAGLQPIPVEWPGPTIDVTQSPYFADSSGENNATDAIQAAIDAVGKLGGGTVYLPQGQYLIEAPDNQNFALGISYNHVRLIGAGPDKTYLRLDSEHMRSKDVIRIYGEGDWRQALNAPQIISSPLTGPTQIIPLSDVSRFDEGDWIIITHDTTEAWILEHNMDDLWSQRSIDGVTMYRKIIAVDADAKTITVDAPIRYYLLPRDNARVYRVGAHVEEVGVGYFSLGMTEHPGDGWGNLDYNVEGTAAYDIHNSYAVRFSHVVNSWVHDVHSYKPEDNARAHLLSNGIVISQSRYITIDGVDLREPQYRGEGGNGNLYTITGNDSLIINSAAHNGRHNYTFSTALSNGNVISQSYSNGSSSQSLTTDFHMRLSPSNLLDQVVVYEDRLDAGWRGWAGRGLSHGLSTTQTTFWNTRGERYKGTYNEIIYSEQYGWGYIIGTQGPHHNVITKEPARPYRVNQEDEIRLLPEDYTEGIGLGEGLIPSSLYLDQVERRLNRKGIIHCPEVDFRPPTPRISINYPRAGEAVKGQLQTNITIQSPKVQGAHINRVTVWLDDDEIFQGRELNEQLKIDTTALRDGQHTLTVEAVLNNDLATRQRVAFSATNTWNLRDRLDAPVNADWFGEVSRQQTIDRSDGWAYDTSTPDAFFGDNSRRIRLKDTAEYLVWEAKGLKAFTIILYSKSDSASEFVQLSVLDNNGEGWRKLSFDTRHLGQSEAGWYRIELTGEVPNEIQPHQFRLSLLPNVGNGDDIQIGEVNLSGQRL